MNELRQQQPQAEQAPGSTLEPLQLRRPRQDSETWAEHDQLPDEGAWLYVASRVTLDSRDVRGAWLPADTKPLWAAYIVGQHVGDMLACADLVVLDQTGLDELVDENHYVPELRP